MTDNLVKGCRITGRLGRRKKKDSQTGQKERERLAFLEKEAKFWRRTDKRKENDRTPRAKND
jgi:hypothetical protein